MQRKLIAGLLVVACGGLMLPWLLGRDFNPWVATAKESLKARFVNLVDEYELQLRRAKDAVEGAQERAVTLKVQHQKSAAGLVIVDRELNHCRQEITGAKAKLAELRDQLNSGESIRFVNGRAASEVDLRNLVAKCATRIELAEEKATFLQQMRERRSARNSKLETLDQQSPGAITRLQNSVDYLEQKVTLYRDMKEWLAQDEAEESQLSGIYQNAQRTLEEAHAKLDAKLAEIDAILSVSIETEIVPAAGEPDSASLSREIHAILGDAYAVSK
jgi:chromosome segregation ATPase